jgi:hypothetical protein
MATSLDEIEVALPDTVAAEADEAQDSLFLPLPSILSLRRQ